MAHRSPILGYNHNVNYRGLVFHIQTEDSGVDNPHVFTHLFQGGVILTTRKLEYDVAAAEDVVKMLMQAQHKSVLKGLRRGEFDEKIDAYLGNDPKLRPRHEQPPDAASPAAPAASEPDTVATVPRAATPSEVASASPGAPRAATPGEARAAAPRAATPGDAVPVELAAAVDTAPALSDGVPNEVPQRPSGSIRSRRYSRPGTSGQSLVQRAPPPVEDSSRTAARSGKVLVSGPPIVVDSSGKRDVSRPGMRPPPRAREESRDSIFDQNLITEKSLDEVILAYLSEDAED